MLDDGTQNDIINGDLGVYNGAIFENIIADIFNKSRKKIYDYSKNNSSEIDFFIRLNQSPYAVEVKSADNTKAKSLKTLLEKNLILEA